MSFLLKTIKKFRFSTPYPWHQRKLFLCHSIVILLLSSILFGFIYYYSLKNFSSKITIKDWPLPQTGAKNATFFCDNKDEMELFEFFDTNLKGILPSLLDLTLFCLSLSVDSILFGGKMSIYRYYYTVFALVKNTINIIIILLNAKYIGFNINELGFVKNGEWPGLSDINEILNWVFLLWFKAAPIWSMHNFLFLPTVLAFVKYYKNVQDFKYYVNVAIKNQFLFKFLIFIMQTFYTLLFFILIFYAIVTCFVATITGFGVGILIVPLIMLAIIFFNGLLSLPFHLLGLYFNKPKKNIIINNPMEEKLKERLIQEEKKKVEKIENSVNSVHIDNIDNSDEDNNYEDDEETEKMNKEVIERISIKRDEKTEIKNLDWRKINEKLIKQRQKTFSRIKNIIIWGYVCLGFELMFFMNYEWRQVMKFYFYPPYLGFNVYRIDFGIEMNNYIGYLTTILNLI